ncbi:MAG: CRISPR-associated endonuclease Cas1 [Thermoanaerobaculia bacterium]|nr:CRISPR-associated endonuclease Cas1 [Thermoanaerobaculia bacterium]
MGARYDAVASEANLTTAWLTVRARRGAGGPLGLDAEGDARTNEAIRELAGDLAAHRYAPAPDRRVVLAGPGGEAGRELSLPSFRDKVVQQAVRQVLEPILEPAFLDCSYAYRPRRGAQRAVRRILHEIGRERAEWVARGDVDDFFDSIPRERLLAALAPRLDDPDLLALIRLFLANAAIDWRGSLHDRMAGVPTGSVLGPLLANSYLHALDLHLRERGVCHVRYADDWVLLARDRAGAVAAATAAETFLREELGLRLNDGRHALSRVGEGFLFVGFRIAGRRLAIDPAKLDGVPRRLAELGRETEGWEPRALVARLAVTAGGWQRYYGVVDRQEDLARLDRHLAEFLARSLLDRDAEATLPLDDLLRDFPWPGRDSLLAEELVREAIARERTRRRHEAAERRAVVRQRRRAKGHAAERSEIVVWRSGAAVESAAGSLVVRDGDGAKLLERPWARVRSLQIQGRDVKVGSAVLQACAERELPLSFVDRRGRPYALVHAPGSLAVELLTLQLRAADGAAGRELGAALAQAKVKNQGNLLKYLAKYRRARAPGLHGDLVACARTIAREARRIGAVAAGAAAATEPGAAAGADWRGAVFAAEGRAAEAYWRAAAALFPGFPGRRKQDAADPLNAALNYGYGILYGRVEQAILRAGLHSGIGFLHRGDRGRPALAFDLVEPFRAPVVDRTVFAMVARREKLALDESGRLTGTSRKAVAARVLERWLTETPYGDRPADYESILLDQLQRLRRRLQGGPAFRAFLQRW